MVPPHLHPHLHPHCVLPRLRCPATGSARILIRLGLKPFCCSFSASSVRTPPPLHGPSLRRGRRPLDYPDPFARAFDLAALRVPAAACAPLERRLRGHLLNWPRVRNVVRLPNDQGLLSLSLPPPRYPAEEPAGPTPRATAVAQREKLVRELNARGFLRFPNLARFSRPSRLARKRRERKGDGGDEEATREPDKDKAYVVEVVGERGEDDDEWKGLVGEEGFGRDAWRIGSTRLLLLDERYAERKVDELPEAVKDVLDHETQHDGSSAYELIRCHLTLFYNYWSMNEVLEALLPEGVIIPTGFETIGHIAHLNLRDEHLPYKELIASVVLDKNKPKIRTVVNKTDVIQNNYRTMQLEVLAGNGSLRTMVIENGLRFQVDLGIVYWNSRLATERQRLVNNIFRNLDIVCDMFSGVGPLAISAAKKVKYVYANDINPNAVEYLERNMVLNKLERKIEVFNMDARRFVSAIYSSKHVQPVTQIVMNLPNDAAEFLGGFSIPENSFIAIGIYIDPFYAIGNYVFSSFLSVYIFSSLLCHRRDIAVTLLLSGVQKDLLLAVARPSSSTAVAAGCRSRGCSIVRCRHACQGHPILFAPGHNRRLGTSEGELEAWQHRVLPAVGLTADVLSHLERCLVSLSRTCRTAPNEAG